MGKTNNNLDLASDVLKVFKEKEFRKIEERLSSSYIELMKVESQSRRKKSSVNIRAMQLLDKEMYMLEFEYRRVVKKFNINRIPELDDYIEEIKRYRIQLVKEKNALR